MESASKPTRPAICKYLWAAAAFLVSCFLTFQYEITPHNAEQSLLVIKEAYKAGDYQQVMDLAASYRLTFKQEAEEQLISYEKLASRELEAKRLFQAIERAVERNQPFEVAAKCTAYQRLFPNCADADQVLKIIKKQPSVVLPEAIFAVSNANRSSDELVRWLIVDNNANPKELHIAVYLPNATPEKLEQAVFQIRLEMPAWEHVIIFVSHPDFQLSSQQEEKDKIIADYHSVTRAITLYDQNGKQAGVINSFP